MSETLQDAMEMGSIALIHIAARLQLDSDYFAGARKDELVRYSEMLRVEADRQREPEPAPRLDAFKDKVAEHELRLDALAERVADLDERVFERFRRFDEIPGNWSLEWDQPGRQQFVTLQKLLDDLAIRLISVEHNLDGFASKDDALAVRIAALEHVTGLGYGSPGAQAFRERVQREEAQRRAVERGEPSEG